ncbi:MAG: carotenoid 1,2-hydratase, partial [Blastocatellia bacterium]|nr:carotenoid 1,2-hydratase [Blastocatellia bacterium]
MKIEIVDILEQFAVDVVDNLVSSFIGSPQPLIRATHERAVELPRDTYAHEDVQTEWWYYTGHLHSGDRPFGFELVFFKRRTDLDRFGKIIPMRILGSVNYYAHFAVTDISDKKFRYFHKRSINGSSPAGATTDRYKVWLDNWSAKEINGLHMLSAQMNQTKLELALKPIKPVVKHGINGLSFKDEGEASYYLAYTRMEAEGELTIGGKEFPVKGSAWMDHEFGSWTMKQKIQGWDWFAL